MNYRTAVLKRNLELVGMFPFVLLGKLAGMIFPLKGRPDVFIFSPGADIGGSIKVNADIAECIKDKKPVIIFSKKPKNNKFRHLFDIEGVRVIDLHKYVDNKAFHFVNFFFRGVIASWANQAEKPVIFGGESIFFYKIVPHVKASAKVVELCHLNTWFNFSQAFARYIDVRIFSTPQIKRDVEAQYEKNGVPYKYRERLVFVDNKIPIPERRIINNKTLQVVFVGRGSPQKRVHLLAEVARRLHDEGADIHFSFAGDVENLVPVDVQKYCTMYGNVQDVEKLKSIYDRSDVLLLTSAFEGLPIVVMDMMARGKAIVSTAVGGIPDYITDEENGLLVYETDEDAIVVKSAELLKRLHHDRELLKRMGDANYRYALEHFSGEKFCSFYRKMLVV